MLAQLGARRAFVVHGAHGIDELSPAGPNDVCEVVDGEVHERVIDPLELGIQRCDPAELRGGSPAENAQAIRDVFAGADGGRRDAILLNAAGAIAAAGHAEDLQEGLELAREAIDSGTAAARLDELASFRMRFRDALAAARSRRDRRVQASLALARRHPPGRRARRARRGLRTRRRCRRLRPRRRALRGRLGRSARGARERRPAVAREGLLLDRAAPATAREAGADAVLLLLRDLDDGQTATLMALAGSSASTHSSKRTTPTSSTRAIALRAPVIGINARDLATFAIDRARSWI